MIGLAFLAQVISSFISLAFWGIITFCQGDREHGLAHGRARIEVLGVAEEFDTQGREFLQGHDEVLDGPSEPVKAVHQD